MRRALILSFLFSGLLFAQEAIFIPVIDGDWWTVAGNPDVHPYTTPEQQPVDFGVWPAADDTWQLWSCIRKTSIPGRTRLLHRWEGKRLTDRDWTPMGIAMTADPGFGETPGGLQAPHVITHQGLWQMFYGDWVHLCRANSADGKTFARQLTPAGKAGIFGEGPEANARDAMVIRINGRWHCYYTAHPNRKGAVYVRTSDDMKSWSQSKMVSFGGEAGTEFYHAECPHVVEYKGWFYLFRTQRYLGTPETRVYRSKNPMDFGIDDDQFLVAKLPVAAPEIILHEGDYYIASLLPNLQGIRIARLSWQPR
jgi:glycosyl hydrolase family 43